MADTDLGDLSFTLSVKSNVEEQMEKIRKSIEKTKSEINDFEKIANDDKTEKKRALVAKLAADKLRKGISEYESGLKSLGTRYNQILDITKKIEASSKAVHNLRKGNVGPFDPKALRSYSKELGNLMRRVIAISKGNLNGPNFKMVLGDVKRELSQISKGIGGITSGASKAGTKAAREAQKVVDDFEKAEDQAAKYYRTRKTRVEDAITSLSKKQGQLHEMMGNASKEDANLMKAASDQAEILIKRLSAAKEQYERMQTLKAQGVLGAALSATYLGRYTGMSELFGGNFSKMDKTGIADALSNFAGGGTLSYSAFLQMYREVVALGKSHAETQEQYNKQESKEAADKERVYQQTLDKTNRDLERNQKAAERTEEAQTKAAERSAKAEIDAANATEVRIARLRSILSEGLTTRRDSKSLGLNVDELTEKLRRLAQVILAIRADKQGFGYATNLFDKGADKVEISSIQEKIRAQRELNAEKERQQRIDERNNNSLIANRDKRGYIQNNIDSILGKWADISPNVQNSHISKIVKNLQNLSKSLSGLSDKDLMDANAVTNLLRRRHYGTMAKEIGAFFRQYRQEAMAAAAEAKTAKEAEDRLTSQINRMNKLASDWDNRGITAKSDANRTRSADWSSNVSNNAIALGNIKRSDYKTDKEYIDAVNEALRQSKHLQEESRIAASQYAGEQKAAAQAAQQTAANQQKAAEATKQNVSAARSLADEFGRVHNKSRELSSTMSELKTMFLQGGGLYAAQSLVNSIVQTGGQIEQQHIALRAMIGDAQEADALFGQMKTLAINSPFTFSEIIRDTKMMTAYGIAQKDVYETTKRLADISAGLGVSVERLALAFGQVHARGWLDAKELRQFAYAGLPLLSRLSEYYTGKEGKEVSPEEVTKRIKKRQVGFEDVKSVLWELTDKGGQFYNMQDQLTDTLLGKYNKLKDAWDIMLSDFTNGGNVVGNVFKGVLDALANIIQGMHVLSPLLASAAAFFGGKKLLGMVGGALGFGNVQKDIFIAQRNKMQEFAASTLERTLAGEITQQEMTQLMLDRQQTYEKMKQNGSLYSMLAVSGQLKPMEIFRLMNSQKQTAQTKVQTAELAKQLQMMGILSKSQAGFLVSGNKFGFGASTVLGKIGGFLKANWLTAALTAVGAIWSSANEFYEKNKQKGEEAASQAKSAINELNQLVDKNKNKKLSSGYISGLQATLKESHLYTVSMDQQIARATTLAEKYKVIKKAIADAKFVQDHGDMVTNALNASKYGTYNHWWEYIIGNSQNVKNGGLGTWWGNQLFDDSLEDNIKQLQEAQVAYEDLKRTGVASQDEIRKASEKVRDAWREMTYDDIPRMVNSITKDLHQTGIAWSNLARSAKHDFVVAINQVVEAAGIAGTQLGRQMFALMWMMRAHPGWVTDQKKMNAALMVYGKFYDNNFKKWTAPDKTYNPSDTGTKKNKKTGGSHEDKEANELRREIQLVKEAYDTYEKWYGIYHNKPSAINAMRADYGPALKKIGINIENIYDFGKALETLKDKADKLYKAGHKGKEMTNVLRELGKAMTDNKFTQAKHDMDDLASTTSRDLSIMQKKWELYKEVLKSTGDVSLANQVSQISRGLSVNGVSVTPDMAFGTGRKYKLSDSYRNYIDDRLSEAVMKALRIGDKMTGEQYNAVNKIALEGIDYDKVRGLDNSAIEKYVGDLFKDFPDKSATSSFIELLKAFRDADFSEYKEGVEAYIGLLGKIVDYSTQITRDTESYNETIKQLKDLRKLGPGNGGINEAQYQKASSIALDEFNHNKLIHSRGYDLFMNFSGSLTKKGVYDMYNAAVIDLNKRFTDGLINIKDYTDGINNLNDKLREFNDKKSDAYAFATGGLNGLFSNMEKRGQSIGGDKGAELIAKAKGGASTVATIDAIINGINNNVQSYKKFEQNFTEAFGDHLKNSKFSNFMGGFAEASQGAADGWNSLKNGDFVGTFDGVLRSFTGWFSWGNAAANKRYQEQVEYYKKFLSVMQDISSSLSEQVSSAYGSQSIAAARKLKNSYVASASEAQQTFYDWSQAHTIHKNHRNRMYVFGGKGETRDYFAQINAYLRSSGYTGQEIGGDSLQNLSGDWLTKIKEDLPDAWAHMNEEARSYLETIIKATNKTGEMDEATKKLGEVLTGMTFEGVQQSWESLLDNLDSDNDDFAKDFEKKMRNAILNGMISNLYKDRINAMIKEATDLGTNDTYVDKYGNIKKHYKRDSQGNLTYDEDDIASEYTNEEYQKIKSENNEIAQEAKQTRDMLKDLYGWSDSGSLSASSSIKGISEQTADLLASYLNAIRADVSVIRQMEGIYLPKFNATIEAQLQQLDSIAQNTSRNAIAAESIQSAVSEMRDLLNSTTRDGAKYINVRVK